MLRIFSDSGLPTDEKRRLLDPHKQNSYSKDRYERKSWGEAWRDEHDVDYWEKSHPYWNWPGGYEVAR